MSRDIWHMLYLVLTLGCYIHTVAWKLGFGTLGDWNIPVSYLFSSTLLSNTWKIIIIHLGGAYICPVTSVTWKCVSCISQLLLRQPQGVGLRPGSLLPSAPGAIWVKCLDQGPSNRFIILSAPGFEPATLPNAVNLQATCNSYTVPTVPWFLSNIFISHSGNILWLPSLWRESVSASVPAVVVLFHMWTVSYFSSVEIKKKKHISRWPSL